jgi:hypothetical protein
MTVIDLAEKHPTLEEVIGLAKDRVVVLRQPDGSAFAVTQLGDFEVEVELLKNNPDFLSFLRQLSREEATISLPRARSVAAGRPALCPSGSIRSAPPTPISGAGPVTEHSAAELTRSRRSREYQSTAMITFDALMIA